MSSFLNPITGLRRVGLALSNDRLSLGSLVHTAARIHGDRTMVDERAVSAQPGLLLSFAGAARLVDEWAGWFAEHVEAGDRVVVATPNGYEQFLLTLAVSRAGAIPAPVNPNMSEREIAHVTADTAASLVISSSAEVQRGRPLGADLGAELDVAALLYTSGTTGLPKGAALSHESLVGHLGAAALVPSGLLDIVQPGFEMAMALPVAHVMGFVVCAAAVVGGISVRSIPQFHPTVVLDEIESRRVSMFIGVPAMYRMLESAGASERDLSCVRVWGSGADVMPAQLAKAFKSYGAAMSLPLLGPIGEAAFVEGYGMVEIGGGALAKISPPFTSMGLGDSIGVPLPGYQFRVAGEDGAVLGVGQVGELQIRSRTVLVGYWGDEAATDAVMTDDGWLRTGDEVMRTPLGGIVFVGRAKNTLKVGGYSVYPPEIEAVLESHPEVLEAAVIGAPDDTLGEVPWAAVVLTDNASKPESIRAWAADRLAEYKQPRRLLAVDALPRTGTGKVQRDALRTSLGIEEA